MIDYLLASDFVQVGKDHALAQRADVMKGALHNHAGFHAHERQRTSTIAPVVRGFKINGDECGWGRGRSCRGVGTLAYGSDERNLRDTGYGQPRWLW